MPQELMEQVAKNAPAVIMLAWVIWRQQKFFEHIVNELLRIERTRKTDQPDNLE